MIICVLSQTSCHSGFRKKLMGRGWAGGHEKLRPGNSSLEAGRWSAWWSGQQQRLSHDDLVTFLPKRALSIVLVEPRVGTAMTCTHLAHSSTLLLHNLPQRAHIPIGSFLRAD